MFDDFKFSIIKYESGRRWAITVVDSGWLFAKSEKSYDTVQELIDGLDTFCSIDTDDLGVTFNGTPYADDYNYITFRGVVIAYCCLGIPRGSSTHLPAMRIRERYIQDIKAIINKAKEFRKKLEEEDAKNTRDCTPCTM